MTEGAPKRGQRSIEDKEHGVSYLGVELPKAQNRENAPKQDFFADYINDDFSLQLQKKIATALKLGDPILLEGGTSIGKTRTIKKMCADLGWEVHYVNLNGATDVEDLMGRYIPNHSRTNSNEPEYVFADGKVTSGLRREEDKKKLIILDEYNAASPSILIRLHEVLDALRQNGEVVLSEDASEKLEVSHADTKVVALMNPPGKGYLERQPLDPAQIRRFVYQKEVTDLPKDTVEHFTKALFNVDDRRPPPPPTAYLESNEATLTQEQLKEIPGIEHVIAKYNEFHDGAKKLVGERHVAKDQPQKFTFDDREEPRRVRDFITHFYRGDINETMQQALRYFYAGKVLDEGDKRKLEELIRTVEYTPPRVPSRRREVSQSQRELEEEMLGRLDAALRTPEKLEGRDPKEFLNKAMDRIYEEYPATSSASNWYWVISNNGKRVAMNTIPAMGSLLEEHLLIDKVVPDHFHIPDEDRKPGVSLGIHNLVKELEGKRVLSVVDGRGEWFLEVLDGSKTEPHGPAGTFVSRRGVEFRSTGEKEREGLSVGDTLAMKPGHYTGWDAEVVLSPDKKIVGFDKEGRAIVDLGGNVIVEYPRTIKADFDIEKSAAGSGFTPAPTGPSAPAGASRMFESVSGDSVFTTGETEMYQHGKIVRVGDKMRVKDDSDSLGMISLATRVAREIEVVGFDKDSNVVLQLDGGRVDVVTPNTFSGKFEKVDETRGKAPPPAPTLRPRVVKGFDGKEFILTSVRESQRIRVGMFITPREGTKNMRAQLQKGKEIMVLGFDKEGWVVVEAPGKHIYREVPKDIKEEYAKVDGKTWSVLPPF